MKNFIFYAPTKVVFGKNTESQVGALVREFGGNKVLVHFGGKSARASGLLHSVEESLKSAGIEFVELGGVVPNPLLSKVLEGADLCRRENVDFILAVGGGSVIDSSKAIAYALKYDGDVWDFYCGKAKPASAAPVGSVLTLAAAGSEMSDSSVITNDNGMLKRGCSSPFGHCRFAVMNPMLTFSLSPYQTASGCVDIIMHTLERYFSVQGESLLQDSIAEALIRSVVANSKILMARPDDYDARSQIMWASTMSHNGATGYRFNGDWACHQLEHELSGMFGVAHGAGLSAIWGSWARYVLDVDDSRFARLGAEVFGVSGADLRESALKSVCAAENFFASLGMPISIRDMGIEIDETIADKLAYKCSFAKTRTIGGFKKLDFDDMRKIYLAAAK